MGEDLGTHAIDEVELSTSVVNDNQGIDPMSSVLHVAQVEVNLRVNDGRWGECNSDEVDKGSHSDGREHGSFQPQAQALIVAEPVDNNVVLDVEHMDMDGGKKDASLIIEVKLLKVVEILGISVEGHIGELRRFVSKMVEEDK